MISVLASDTISLHAAHEAAITVILSNPPGDRDNTRIVTVQYSPQRLDRFLLLPLSIDFAGRFFASLLPLILFSLDLHHAVHMAASR